MHNHHAFSLFSPPTDSVVEDGELSTVCYRPEGLDQLLQQTKFTRRELQILYRGFKNVRLSLRTLSLSVSLSLSLSNSIPIQIALLT